MFSVKVQRRVNSNANVDAENGFRPIACVCMVTINAMLNIDGDVDANADVKCEQSMIHFFSTALRCTTPHHRILFAVAEPGFPRWGGGMQYFLGPI